MAFQINNDEWEKLDGEPTEVFKIYCLIRKHMDFKKGITGVERRLRDQDFRDALRVNYVRGRNNANAENSKNTRQKFRSIVGRLEKIGLISCLGEHVFKCNLASLDKSDQIMNNRWTTNEQPIRQPDEQPKPELTKPLETSSKDVNEADMSNPMNNPMIFDDASMNNPYQVSGNQERKTTTNVVDFAKCSHDEIIALYHEILPMCPIVRKWTKKRKASLNARMKEDKDIQSLSWWKGYFEYVAKSPFLIGETAPSPGRRRFIANLEWLISEERMAQIMEGNFHDE